MAVATDSRLDQVVQTVLRKVYSRDPSRLTNLMSLHSLTYKQALYVEILSRCTVKQLGYPFTNVWLSEFEIKVMTREFTVLGLAPNELKALNAMPKAEEDPKEDLFSEMLVELSRRSGHFWEYLLFAKETHERLRPGRPDQLTANIKLLLSARY